MKTVRNSRCHNQGRRRPKQLENGEFCRLGSTEQPRVAVIGDSHAGAMFESLGEVGIARSLGFYAVSGPFCAPLLNEFRLTRYADLECVATMAAAVAALLRMEEVRDIVLIAEWANYTSGSRDGDQPAVAIDNYGQAESPDQNRQIFERSLIKTVQILNDGGKNVILVEPVPEFSVHVLDTIYKRIWNGADYADILSFAPRISAQSYLDRNEEVLGSFSRLPNVTVVQVSDIFCDETNCNSVSSAGNVLFSDSNHVTEFGGRVIASRIVEALHGNR